MNNDKVHIVTRKILKNNARIFKEAETLVKNGYEITVVGIRAPGLPLKEEKDGYRIIRIERFPLHMKLNAIIKKISAKKLLFIFTALIGLLRKVLIMMHMSKLVEFSEKVYAELSAHIQRIFQNKIYQPLKDSKIKFGWFYLIKRIIIKIDRLPLRIMRKVMSHLRWLFNSWDYYRKVYILFQDKLPVPSVIHANDLDTLLISYILSRKVKAKLVYDSQELYIGIHTLPRWYKLLLQLMESYLIKRVDKAIVVNEFVAEEINRRYHVKTDEVLYNCPHYYKNHEEKDRDYDLYRKLDVPRNEHIYIYCGGLSKHRGIENIVLSLQHIHNGILVFLGEGVLKEDIITLADSKNLSDRIHFLEYIPHKKVPELLSSASVGILPYENVGLNHYLCSPSKLFHYIMAEVPIACSNFPFLTKVIENNGKPLGSFFDPSTPESIAKAIRSLIVDKTRYNEIKKNLKEAKKIYNWENEEKKLMKIYNSLS